MKRISYTTDDVGDIALHFTKCSRQAISLACCNYTDDADVSMKLKQASIMCKIFKLLGELAALQK